MRKDEFEDDFVAVQDDDVDIDQGSQSYDPLKTRKKLDRLLELKRLRSELSDLSGTFYDDDLFGDEDE